MNLKQLNLLGCLLLIVISNHCMEASQEINDLKAKKAFSLNAKELIKLQIELFSKYFKAKRLVTEIATILFVDESDEDIENVYSSSKLEDSTQTNFSLFSGLKQELETLKSAKNKKISLLGQQQNIIESFINCFRFKSVKVKHHNSYDPLSKYIDVTKMQTVMHELNTHFWVSEKEKTEKKHKITELLKILQFCFLNAPRDEETSPLDELPKLFGEAEFKEAIEKSFPSLFSKMKLCVSAINAITEFEEVQKIQLSDFTEDRKKEFFKNIALNCVLKDYIEKKDGKHKQVSLNAHIIRVIQETKKCDEKQAETIAKQVIAEIETFLHKCLVEICEGYNRDLEDVKKHLVQKRKESLTGSKLLQQAQSLKDALNFYTIEQDFGEIAIKKIENLFESAHQYADKDPLFDTGSLYSLEQLPVLFGFNLNDYFDGKAIQLLLNSLLSKQTVRKSTILNCINCTALLKSLDCDKSMWAAYNVAFRGVLSLLIDTFMDPKKGMDKFIYILMQVHLTELKEVQ